MTQATEFWNSVEQLLRILLQQFINDLDSESIEGVNHYLEHNEYEMAFEGLFIELIKINAELQIESRNKCLEMAKKLGLNKESVFDMNFWNNLQVFLSK